MKWFCNSGWKKLYSIRSLWSPRGPVLQCATRSWMISLYTDHVSSLCGYKCLAEYLKGINLSVTRPSLTPVLLTLASKNDNGVVRGLDSSGRREWFARCSTRRFHAGPCIPMGEGIGPRRVFGLRVLGFGCAGPTLACDRTLQTELLVDADSWDVWLCDEFDVESSLSSLGSSESPGIRASVLLLFI